MLSTKRDDLSRNPLLMQAARNLAARRLLEEAHNPALLAARAGITPDTWQDDLLQSKARQMILLCSRQAGKSTVTALLALHEALYHAGALVLLLSASLRQSQELFRKVKDAYGNIEDGTTTAREESALRMEFSNDSRIVALPGKEATIRGFSGVALLVVDEASRVDDALYQAVRPMLAVSGGRIVLLSTPFGKRGFFFEVWSTGGAAWHRTEVTADECPRIPREWLAEERKQIGDFWFEQEYLCQFKDDVTAVFSYESIQGAMSDALEPRWSIGDALR